MIDVESEENHMLSRGKKKKKKRGHDSAQSVDPADERLFESTYWLQMVEVCQKAQTCKSDVKLFFFSLAGFLWFPFISNKRREKKKRKRPKTQSGNRAIRHSYWLVSPSGGTSEKPWLAAPHASPGQLSVESELLIRNACRLIRRPFQLEGQ